MMLVRLLKVNLVNVYFLMPRLFLIALLFFVGCKSQLDLPDPPEDLISKEEMVVITKELMLVEAAIELRYGQITKFHKISTASGKAILEKHKCTEDRYFRSLKYYSTNEEEIDFIYSSILDSLNVEMNVP